MVREYACLGLLDNRELGMERGVIVWVLKMKLGLNSKEPFVSAQRFIHDPGGNGETLEV